jgi:uncharacterized membrane protein (UPF0136 family)
MVSFLKGETMSFKVVFLVCIAVGLLFFLISAVLLAQVSGGLKYVVLASTALLASGLIALAINDRK